MVSSYFNNFIVFTIGTAVLSSVTPQCSCTQQEYLNAIPRGRSPEDMQGDTIIRVPVKKTGRLAWNDKYENVRKLADGGNILLAQQELNIFLKNRHRIPSQALPQLHIEHGKLQSQLGYYKAAIRSYEEALNYGIRTPHAHIALAHLHVRLGDLNTAIESLKHALFVDAECEEAIHDLASLYFLLGDIESALFYFKLAVSRNRNGTLSAISTSHSGPQLSMDVWLADHVLGVFHSPGSPVDPSSKVRIRDFLNLSKDERAVIESSALFLTGAAVRTQMLDVEAKVAWSVANERNALSLQQRLVAYFSLLHMQKKLHYAEDLIRTLEVNADVEGTIVPIVGSIINLEQEKPVSRIISSVYSGSVVVLDQEVRGPLRISIILEVDGFHKLQRVDDFALLMLLKNLRWGSTRPHLVVTALLLPASGIQSKKLHEHSYVKDLAQVVDKLIVLQGGQGYRAVRSILKKHTRGSDAVVFVSPWKSDEHIALTYTRFGRRQIGLWLNGQAPLLYRNDALDYIVLPHILQASVNVSKNMQNNSPQVSWLHEPQGQVYPDLVTNGLLPNDAQPGSLPRFKYADGSLILFSNITYILLMPGVPLELLCQHAKLVGELLGTVIKSLRSGGIRSEILILSLPHKRIGFEHFAARLRQYSGLETGIRVTPPLSHSEYLALLAATDLIAHVDMFEKYFGVYTSLFECISVGTPVLTYISDESSIQGEKYNGFVSKLLGLGTTSFSEAELLQVNKHLFAQDCESFAELVGNILRNQSALLSHLKPKLRAIAEFFGRLSEKSLNDAANLLSSLAKAGRQETESDARRNFVRGTNRYPMRARNRRRRWARMYQKKKKKKGDGN